MNGHIPKKMGDKLHEGDIVEMYKAGQTKEINNEKKIKPIPLQMISVLAETPEYLVVFKPAGVLVHQTEAQEPKTLASWLLQHYPDIAGVGGKSERSGIVHRLDKEASGVLVVARTEKMFQHLKIQFKNRTVQKEYIILVYGEIEADIGTINFDIDRAKDGRMASRPKISNLTAKKIASVQPGKTALTEFFVIKRYPRYTLLDVKIHSGRRHQIRVHLFAFGHPIVGDTLYKNIKLTKKHDQPLNRLFLHAKKLCFQDLTNTQQCYESPLPAKLQSYLDTLNS